MGHVCLGRRTQRGAYVSGPSCHGTQALPQLNVPINTNDVTLRGNHGHIFAPKMAISARRWGKGDKVTWHCSSEETPVVKEIWRILLDKGTDWIDTAQTHGDEEKERIVWGLGCGLLCDGFII